MIRIKNLPFSDGRIEDLQLPSDETLEIDGSHLLALPALIDPHVHFRVPGGEAKEDWMTGASAAIRGGVTQVLDMPNTNPPSTTLERFLEKKLLINSQLETIGIPLRYGLYFGADKEHLEEIGKAAHEMIAIKVFMGCSTGGLVIDDDQTLDAVFQRAKAHNLLVAVHAEDEMILRENKKKYPFETDPAIHSKIRSRLAAITATKKAIALSAKYQTPLYVLHMSTKEEIALVREAKKCGVPVFAECCSHHLFLNEEAYAVWGTLVQMNPPLRTKEDQEALFEGIYDGTIDTIGTDHAPHLLSEKRRPYGEAPSGIPGIETLLPLLLNAVSQKKLTIEKLISLTRTNIEKIFGLPQNNDLVIVDLQLEKEVQNKELKTKCGWSPFAGQRLLGWPIFTILKGKVYFAAGSESSKKKLGKDDK